MPDQGAPGFWVCVYDNLYRTEANMQQLSGAGLVDLLTTPGEAFRVQDKGRLMMWSPVQLRPPRKRAKRNVLSASCLVLDYDDGSTIEEALALWGQWYAILHTSWSHRPDGHRFRVVLPLQRDVAPEEYPRVWAWAEAYSGKVVDRQCKDISRAWALPAVDLEDEEHRAAFRAEVAWGPLLDPEWAISHAPPPPPPPPKREVALRDLPDYDALRGLHLEPDERAELGHVLGGVVNDECVRLVECPRCRRPAVWWWLDPTRQVNAYCNHRQSCGWKGPVAALLNNDVDLTVLES